MNFKSIKKVDTKEALTCLLLVIIGYMTAQLFMRRMNGFNVGAQSCKCDDCKDSDGKIRTYYDKCSELSPSDCQYGYSKDSGGGKFKCIVGGDKCNMSGGKPNITGTCPDCKDPSTNGTKMTRGQCQGLSKKDCSRMWGLDSNSNPKPCTWTESQNKCNIGGGQPMKCPAGPPAGPPADASSYNCSGSMCVNVSGTDGTYSSESDCLNSDCEKTTPSFNCSSSGYFSTDDCYNNKKLVDPYKWHLPSPSCTDDDCKGCQNTCSMWYGKWGPYILLIILCIIGFIIGFLSVGPGLGIFIALLLPVIEFLILYYINKSVTPELKN